MFPLWKSTYLIYILVCISLEQTDGQRLSQGASDWYMRFHSNFRHVKRDVHPPQIKSFVVSSTITVSIYIYVIIIIRIYLYIYATLYTFWS